MSGKVIFSTGSFLGEMGTTADGELFINSHGKGRGVVLEGIREFSQSAAGELIEKTLDASTGLVKSEKIRDSVKGITYRRSGSSVHNQIEFEQTNNGAFISVSGSAPGFNIKETDTTAYSLWRSDKILFISGTGWSVGQNSNQNLALGNDITPTTTPQLEIRNSPDEVVVSGSLNVDGTISATRKSFDIQHPSKPDKRLIHGSLEGPEFGVYIRGKVESNDKIELPDYWVDLVDMDTLSVHLTPINTDVTIYFTFSDNKYIYINREADFFYFVCAERKDIDRLQVEQ